MPDLNDATDPLAKPRASIVKAIGDLRSFSAPAGSKEMRAVSAALDHLGYAHSYVSQPREGNPAWSDGGPAKP